MKHNQFFDQQTRCYKGGGGGSSKKVKTPPAPNMPSPQEIQEMEIRSRAAELDAQLRQQEMAMMQQNADMQRKLMEQIKPPEPPPKMSLLEVQEAEDAKKQDSKKRSGIRKTLLAGETGGYAPTATGKALLG
jgi:hypothetical protein